MIYRRLFPLQLVLALILCASSLAGERVLFKKDSPYNHIVVSENDAGLRTLRFGEGDIRQSVVKPGEPEHLELPYARAMPLGLALVDEPKRILIVGLGGGTIPMFLHKYYPRTTIDVVDIDPEVVDAACKFFGFRADATLHVRAEDGRKFIERCREPYDAIFLDAFGAEDIPYVLTTREFLQAVRRALAPKGVVLSNIFTADLNRLYDSMLRTYLDVFEELYVAAVPHTGNTILVALPQRQRVARGEFVQRAKRLSKEKGFRYELGAFAAKVHRCGKKELEQGCVLLDKDKPKGEQGSSQGIQRQEDPR
jgi:spermidine synthase